MEKLQKVENINPWPPNFSIIVIPVFCIKLEVLYRGNIWQG